MAFFFVFLALTAGMLVVYNTIWQAFFGDVTPLKDRNRVYGFRNRFVFLISTIAPILCGTILTAQPDSPSKLMVLRVFFYICGAVCLLCSFVLSLHSGRRAFAGNASAGAQIQLFFLRRGIPRSGAQ